jgi:uncharacterized protein YjbI with pentapeptide repeats
VRGGSTHLDAAHLDAAHLDAAHLDAAHLDAANLDAALMVAAHSECGLTPSGRRRNLAPIRRVERQQGKEHT